MVRSWWIAGETWLENALILDAKNLPVFSSLFLGVLSMTVARATADLRFGMTTRTAKTKGGLASLDKRTLCGETAKDGAPDL
jgi:hypothetical protein